MRLLFALTLCFASQAFAVKLGETLAKAFAFHEQFLRTGDMSGAGL